MRAKNKSHPVCADEHIPELRIQHRGASEILVTATFVIAGDDLILFHLWFFGLGTFERLYLEASDHPSHQESPNRCYRILKF